MECMLFILAPLVVGLLTFIAVYVGLIADTLEKIEKNQRAADSGEKNG